MQCPQLPTRRVLPVPFKEEGKIQSNESERSITPPIPLDCEPLSHQVAGHVHGKGKTKIGMLQYKDGTILKPFQRPSRGQKEAAFYHSVFYPDLSLPSGVAMETLQPFIPCYYGTVAFEEDPTLFYLKLEDITKKYRKPCIMDVKIGCQTYEDSATQYKKENAKIKYPNMLRVGFQISGMRIYYANVNKYEYYDKSYGRLFNEDTVIEGLKKFFQYENNFQSDAVTKLLDLLHQLEAWFENQNLFHFISSSILFVYEGDQAESVSHRESIPELVPKTRNESKVRNFSSCNGFGDNQARDVHQSTDKPLVNGCTIRPENTQCVISSSHVVNHTSNEPKLTKEPNNKCNNGFGQNMILLKSNKNEIIEAEEYGLEVNSISNCLAPEQQFYKDCDEETCRGKNCPADLKMIDFTHVIDENETDDNYLFGLRKLISNLEVLKD